MGEEPTDFLPDGFIDQIGAQLLVPAEPHPTEAVGIRANAVIIRVRTHMVFASTGTDSVWSATGLLPPPPIQNRACAF